jgi:hypothetical protein
MVSRSSIVATLALLTLGAGKRDAGTPPPPPKADLWDFDGIDAPVSAHGEVKDPLSRVALQQLGAQVDGSARLVASAHANSVGGITLKLADAHDATAFCELYTTRAGTMLTFDDSRCTFPVFQGQARTLATCRHISGTARRSKDAVLIDATASDCTAQPLGLPLALSGRIEPVIEKR